MSRAPVSAARDAGLEFEAEAVEPATESVELDGETDALRAFLAAIGRYPLLTPSEEVQLAKRVELGDRAARERMITSNLRLVVSFARRHRRAEVPLLDLIQDGMLGLIRAVEGYDWRRGYRFSTYASWWIRQAMHRGSDGPIRRPIYVREYERAVLRAERDLEQHLGRSPDDGEISRQTGLPVDTVGRLRRLSSASILSLDRPAEQGGEGALGERLAADTDVFEEAFGALRADGLREALASLPERSREVIVLRYGIRGGEPLSLREIGRKLGLSGQRVYQIEQKALELLSASPQLARANERVRGGLGAWLRAVLIEALPDALRAALPQKLGAKVAASVALAASTTAIVTLPGYDPQRPGSSAPPPTVQANRGGGGAGDAAVGSGTAGPAGAAVGAVPSVTAAAQATPDSSLAVPAASTPGGAADPSLSSGALLPEDELGAEDEPSRPEPPAPPTQGEPVAPGTGDSLSSGASGEPAGSGEAAGASAAAGESPPGPAGTPPGEGGTPPGQGGDPPGLGGPPPGHGGAPPGQAGKAGGESSPSPGSGETTPGQSGTPPGPEGTPPGQGGVPPGQGGDPPGLVDSRPGQGGDPPGHSGDAPGQGGDAPGHGGDSPGHGGTPPGDA